MPFGDGCATAASKVPRPRKDKMSDCGYDQAPKLLLVNLRQFGFSLGGGSAGSLITIM